MIAIVQRVSRAAVRLQDGTELASITNGMVTLIGVEVGDGSDQAEWMAKKLIGLRIFEDDRGKLNLSLREANGAMIVVSQFTLVADTGSGNRPSFIRAANPDTAEALIERVVEILRRSGISVGTGRFGTSMEVELVNDGPVTIPIRTPGSRTQ